MSYSKSEWSQLKGLTAAPLMKALEQDGWILDTTCGSIHTYIKAVANREHLRVQVHFHGKNKGWGPRLIKKMIADAKWSVDDPKRLRLIG